MAKINPVRTSLPEVDWVSAYLLSTSSQLTGDNYLPLPTTPQNVSEGINANTYDQDIVGRSSPLISYGSTGARTISFSIEVADDYMPMKANGTRYTIKSYVSALKSLVYPRYSSLQVIAPQCTLHIGNVTSSGIVTSVNVSWGGPLSSIDGSGVGTFTRATIQIQFKEIRAAVVGSIDIRDGK